MAVYANLKNQFEKEWADLQLVKSDPDQNAELKLILNPPIENPELRCKVGQLKEKLGGKVLSSHNDHDLTRFLMARNLKIDDAVKMYNEMIECRNHVGVDQPGFLESHQPKEAFLNHYPTGQLGYDKDGCPITYEFPGRIDMRGFDLAMSDDDFLKQVFCDLETMLVSMELRSWRKKKLVEKWTLIADMRDLSLDGIRKGDLESSGDLEHMLDICYPERMNRILVVNISPVFDILYKLFKPFLPTATKQKVVILKNYSELLKYIDEDQLPVCYGGTKVDDNGDPECKQWITLGSKVDKSLYKYSQVQNDKSLCHTEVSSRATFEWEVEAEQNDVIMYRFCSDSKSVKYGVYYRDSKNAKNKIWIVEKKSVAAEKELIESSFVSEEKRTYVLFVQNKWIKAANISFDITPERLLINDLENEKD